MTEIDVDWSDEGEESEKSTENDNQDSVSEESDSGEEQKEVESPIAEGPRDIDSDFDQDDNTSLLYGVEMADPVCVKLNDLFRRGKLTETEFSTNF